MGSKTQTDPLGSKLCFRTRKERTGGHGCCCESNCKQQRPRDRCVGANGSQGSEVKICPLRDDGKATEAQPTGDKTATLVFVVFKGFT